MRLIRVRDVLARGSICHMLSIVFGVYPCRLKVCNYVLFVEVRVKETSAKISNLTFRKLPLEIIHLSAGLIRILNVSCPVIFAWFCVHHLMFFRSRSVVCGFGRNKNGY